MHRRAVWCNHGTEGNKTACRVVLLLLHCAQRGRCSLNSGADFGFDSKMTNRVSMSSTC